MGNLAAKNLHMGEGCEGCRTPEYGVKGDNGTSLQLPKGHRQLAAVS